MDIRIIKTKQQYRRYLKEVQRLVPLDPDPRSAEGARLELLAKLVEEYEKEQFRFRKPDPVEAILFRMGEQGLLGIPSELLIQEPRAEYRVERKKKRD